MEVVADQNQDVLSKWLKKLITIEEDNIMSSEVFWRMGETHPSGVNTFDPQLSLSQNERAIEKLRNLLKDFDVEIHVFLRRQDLLITSMHKGAVMRGKKVTEQGIADRFILMYPNILKNWTKHFGKSSVKIHLYNESISGNEGISLMTKKMGLSSIYGKLAMHSEINQHRWNLSLKEVELYRECKRLLIHTNHLLEFRDNFFHDHINNPGSIERKEAIKHCLNESIKIIPISQDWLDLQYTRNNDLVDKFEIDRNSTELIDKFLKKESDLKFAKATDPSSLSELAKAIVGSFGEWKTRK